MFTGMGYTDDKAVLPAKEILAGIALDLRRAVLRSTSGGARGCCPSVGRRPVRALGDHARPDRPRGRPAVPGQAPTCPTRRAPTSRPTSTRRARPTTSTRSRCSPYVERAQHRRTATWRPSTPRRRRCPLVDPKIVSQTFEQQQQVRAYYSVPDVLDVDRYEIDGKDRAVVLGVRELDQAGIADGRPELVQPPHRLHPRQRRHRRLRQPATRRTTSASRPACSGPRARRPTRTR